MCMCVHGCSRVGPFPMCGMCLYVYACVVHVHMQGACMHVCTCEYTGAYVRGVFPCVVCSRVWCVWTCREPVCMCVHVCADLNYKETVLPAQAAPLGVLTEVSSWGLAPRTTQVGPKGPLSSFGSVRPPAVSLGDSSETRVRRPI